MAQIKTYDDWWGGELTETELRNSIVKNNWQDEDETCKNVEKPILSTNTCTKIKHCDTLSERKKLVQEYAELIKTDKYAILNFQYKSALNNSNNSSKIIESKYELDNYGNLLQFVLKTLNYYDVPKKNKHSISDIRTQIQTYKTSLKNSQCEINKQIKKCEQQFQKAITNSYTIKDEHERKKYLDNENTKYNKELQKYETKLSFVEIDVATHIIELEKNLKEAESLSNSATNKNIPLEICTKVFNIVRKNSKDTAVFHEMLSNYLKFNSFSFDEGQSVQSELIVPKCKQEPVQQNDFAQKKSLIDKKFKK